MESDYYRRTPMKSYQDGILLGIFGVLILLGWFFPIISQILLTVIFGYALAIFVLTITGDLY